MAREMARKPRLIYPSISTSANLARCSMAAQLLFDRAFVNADDQGRITGDPMKLKLIAVPGVKEITAEDIPGLLEELVANDLFIIYEASSESIIQIKTWWDYQGRQRWAYPSTYPPPQGWQDHVKTRRKEQPEADPDPPSSDPVSPLSAPLQPMSVIVAPEPEPEPEPEPGPGVSPPVGGAKAPLPISAPIWQLKEFFYEELHRSGKLKDQIAVLGKFTRWYLYPPDRGLPPTREIYSQLGGMLKQYGLDPLALLECLLDTLARDRWQPVEDPLTFARTLAMDTGSGQRSRDSPDQS